MEGPCIERNNKADNSKDIDATCALDKKNDEGDEGDEDDEDDAADGGFGGRVDHTAVDQSFVGIVVASFNEPVCRCQFELRLTTALVLLDCTNSQSLHCAFAVLLSYRQNLLCRLLPAPKERSSLEVTKSNRHGKFGFFTEPIGRGFFSVWSQKVNEANDWFNISLSLV